FSGYLRGEVDAGLSTTQFFCRKQPTRCVSNSSVADAYVSRFFIHFLLFIQYPSAADNFSPLSLFKWTPSVYLYSELEAEKSIYPSDNSIALWITASKLGINEFSIFINSGCTGSLTR